ncbi:MAG: LamG domain-containing protein [Bacteroidales bacterium]|nr:LamG domain-containing protein [Bacteroidales bacterium]
MNLVSKIVSSFLLTTVACAVFAQSSVQFDGNEDYIYIQKTEVYDVSAFTVMAWVKWEGSSITDYYGIASNYSGGGTNQHYGIRMSDQGKASVFIDNGTTFQTLNSTININDGEWHHIAGVFDGGNFIKIYVDGALDGTLSTSYAQLTPTSDFYIGVDGSAQGESDWNGNIDNVSIWNYPLNKSYINEWRFKEFTGKELGLIGYWPMNEEVGTVTQDLTGNSNGIFRAMQPLLLQRLCTMAPLSCPLWPLSPPGYPTM